MTTRIAFLARVRREMAKTPGLFAAVPSRRPADPAGEAAAIRARAGADTEGLLARFAAEAEGVGAVVHRAGTAGDAGAIVLRLATARGARRVARWALDRLGPAAAAAARLDGAGLEVFEPRVPTDAASADLGLTTADLAVAETGSVVLASGPGKGRVVSLLPACHVAVLETSRLVGRLEEAGVVLEAWDTAEAGDRGANVVFVTGPSRTADIELTLTRGVHGPRELHVVFVDRA